MADRALSKTLVGEKYSDGTTLNISYSEERSDPELVEQYSPEGSGCTRTFYTAWADRFAFIENMVGFAKLSAATGPIPADGFAGGWDGRHVHRKLPVGYNMGLVDGSGEPVNWVYATRAIAIPDGAKANDASPATVYTPKATYAKIMVTFSALDYDLLSDSAVYNGGGSLGAGTFGCCREWLRYGRIVQKPAHIFFQYPSEGLQEVNWPTGGVVGGAPTNKTLGFQPNVLDNVADFWVYIYDLPYDPIVGVNYCFGHVNKFSIFATPDFTDGQPAESLHLVAADIVRLPLRNSRRYWNLQLGFRKVFNYDYDGTTFVGHNFVRDVVTNGANKQLRFYRVCSDPANPTAQGSAMINLIDFSKLFWIPSSIP